MRHAPPPHAPAAHITYQQAVAEIRALIAATPGNVRPECRPILMEHGHPTGRVFVLMHGLSNCPAQFSELGRQLFERGHNVFIPRMPFHGEKNRMTTSWGKLTAAMMLDNGNRAVDLASGLGDKVIAAGLSVNGTTAAWMAQNRSDLHRAVLLSPFLAPVGLPEWALRPVERILLRLPNVFLWWNPSLKEKNPGPPYAYPRFPTRVIGETMWLGQTVLAQSRREAPRAGSILVVTTASDVAASAAPTAELVANWRKFRPEAVPTYEFPLAEKIPHDFIDPGQPDQQTAKVYPVLLKLLEE